MGDISKVLLVEDSKALAAVYKGYLRGEPCEIVHVDNGVGAIEMLSNNSFDIVLLDLELPDKNGLEILHYMSEHNMPLTVIVITALGSFENADVAMRYGVFDFITKPFNADRLKTAIQNARKEDLWLFGLYNVAETKSHDKAAEDAALVNVQRLMQLEQEVGAERAIDIVRIFIAELNTRLSNISAMLNASDYDRLIQDVTLIKSASATYGLRRIEDISAIIEKAYEYSDFKRIAEEISNLINVSQNSLEELIYYYDLDDLSEVEQSVERKPAVLLVEDSESLAAVYKGYLHSEDYNIFHVKNCYSALEALKSEAYDIVLLDLELPDSNGLEVMEFISSNKLPATVIIITGLGSFKNADIAMKHGAFDFLTKPFNAERLRSALSNARQLDKWLFGEYDSERQAEITMMNKDLEIVDGLVIAGLEEDLGVNETVRAVKVYVQETKYRISQLLVAYKQKNYEWIGKEVHIIKSTSGTYGAMQIHQKAVFVDMACKNGDYATVEQEINKLVELAYIALFELEGYCDSNTTLDVAYG